MSHRRQRRTEPRPRVTWTKNMLKTSRAVSEICSRRDKQRHTDTLIAILRHSYDAGGKTNKVANLRLGAAASCISHVTRIVIAQRERGEWRYRRPYCVHSLAPCSLGAARSRLFVSASPLLPTRACPVDDPAATPSPQISRCCCCWG